MILIAEDEIEVRVFYQELLEPCGYKVKVFEDGESLLSYLVKKELHSEDEQIDLIITDLRMPGRSGEDLIDTFRAISIKYQKVPIFVVSGHIGKIEKDKFSSFSYVKCFLKPLEGDLLLEQVRLTCPL